MKESNWVSKTIEFKEKNQLHLRPAVKITQTAEKFNAEIQFLMGNEVFNAKSITDILIFASALVGSEGNTFDIKASGPEAENALMALSNLFRNELFSEEIK